MITKKLGRYWHTLRHLKPVQFYGRLWLKLYRPPADTSTLAPPMRLARGSWQLPAARAPFMLGPWQFKFLNLEHSLPVQGGWNDAKLEKLWLYNLHYFDDLNARDADQRGAWHQALLERWLLENPPASGNGWEPYPTSLRIVNWVKWLATGNVAPTGMTQSLAKQARWLFQRLEWHLMGNHLFANAKALVFAGLFFEGAEAALWRAKGLEIIGRELPEQVLPDGGNFERSPMYHAIFLEDVLDLVNAANHWSETVPEKQVTQWRETVGRMLHWLTGMTHPDGEIALFNDAAIGIAPGLHALQDFAARLAIEHGLPRFARNEERCGHGERAGIASEAPVIASETLQSTPAFFHFPESGYIRLASNTAVALLDVAPIGPDYLPGHAHADTLSFELSVFGQRVVVNGGTSRYGVGPDRLRERGTAAHSTVQIADQDSSEVWGGFRVARRGYPFDLQVQTESGRLLVACSHDGYSRLPGSPMHRRTWAMESHCLHIADTVRGGTHPALARYILHPNVHISSAGVNTWLLTLSAGQNLRVTVETGHSRVESANYAPEFGCVLPTQCLTVDLIQGHAMVEWAWS
jgi:uncharacterized heparinase superfamily protein